MPPGEAVSPTPSNCIAHDVDRSAPHSNDSGSISPRAHCLQRFNNFELTPRSDGLSAQWSARKESHRRCHASGGRGGPNTCFHTSKSSSAVSATRSQGLPFASKIDHGEPSRHLARADFITLGGESWNKLGIVTDSAALSRQPVASRLELIPSRCSITRTERLVGGDAGSSCGRVYDSRNVAGHAGELVGRTELREDMGTDGTNAGY